MYTKRIFWQIYSGYLVVSMMTLIIFLIVFSSALGWFHRQQTAARLEAFATLSADWVQDYFVSEQRNGIDALSARLGSKSSTRITLILPDGTVIGESDKAHEQMENHRDRPEVKVAIEQGITGQSVRFSQSVRKNMLYVAVPVFRNGTLIGVVRTAMPLLQMKETLNGVEHRLVWGSVAVLVMAAFFSLLIARRLSQPLERIRQGAVRFSQGDFSFRLHSVGSIEINSLAETMNEMASQLEERLQTLTNERNQREAILSSMVEGVLAVDHTGHIISLNKAAAQFFHVFEPDTATGRSLEEVFRNVNLQKFVGEVLAGTDTRECELRVENHQTTYFQARGADLLGLQGRRIGAVIVFNDVSRLRRLENLRRDFVANVSHELKTPITAIKGFVETLLDGAMSKPEDAERFLKIIAKHSDRLNAIIEDLLMLSRLEQDGKAGMEMQSVSLRGLIDTAVEVCAQRAAGKQITIHVECSDALSATINPPLLEQALINLIGNAIKYSTNGKTIQVSAREESGQIILSVKDQGCGIEEVHFERLFERFYRVDKGRSRQEGGTGLGLSIVKHIAQAHGGTVSVESQYGHGSMFSISLPSGRG